MKPSSQITLLIMLSLPGFIKQHLLFGSLIISGALHGLAIFYPFIDESQQSAKGEQYTLLLETSQLPSPRAINEISSGSSSSKLKQPPIQQSTAPQVQAEQPKNPIQLTTEAVPKNIPTLKVQREASSKTIKSNTGENIDMSGKELTAMEKYQKQVLQHILKKIGSAPYFGSARVELTLMRAGIATQIRVKLMDGPSNYQSWLNHKILSANPMPAFPKSIMESQLKLSFPIHHIKEL
mgnify:CR=1 FL=1